jgi:hypothetical protein
MGLLAGCGTKKNPSGVIRTGKPVDCISLAGMFSA